MLLICNADAASALSKACEYDADSDAIHLAKAANIVRRDMFKMKNLFQGSFEKECQEESLPDSLIALVAMVLNGPNILEQSSSSAIPQPILTISQLLMYNRLARCRKDLTSTTRQQRKGNTTAYILRCDDSH